MGNMDFTDSQETGQENQAKTFTQEEVNRIVQERLARDRKEREPDTGTVSQDTRLKALEERELKLTARERLFDEKLPLELADILRYHNEEELKAAIEKIKEINGMTGANARWGERLNGNTMKHDLSIRDAMGLPHAQKG